MTSFDTLYQQQPREEIEHFGVQEGVEFVLNPLSYFGSTKWASSFGMFTWARLCDGAYFLANCYCILGFATWQNEDYVGKCTRVSGRTHAFTTCLRSFARILMQYKRLFNA